MSRWLSFLICTLIFLPIWVGFIMHLWPMVTPRPLSFEVEGDLILISVIAMLTSAGTTGMLFSTHARAGVRR